MALRRSNKASAELPNCRCCLSPHSYEQHKLKTMITPSPEKAKRVLSPAQKLWLAKVDQIIAHRLSDSTFVIGSLAGELYTCERQFYRKLKQITGKTPNQYIQEARVRHARRLLKAGFRGDLTKLSKAVGYQRADYFSRVYQQHYGVRPIQEINKNKRGLAG